MDSVSASIPPVILSISTAPVAISTVWRIRAPLAPGRDAIDALDAVPRAAPGAAAACVVRPVDEGAALEFSCLKTAVASTFRELVASQEQLGVAVSRDVRAHASARPDEGAALAGVLEAFVGKALLRAGWRTVDKGVWTRGDLYQGYLEEEKEESKGTKDAGGGTPAGAGAASGAHPSPSAPFPPPPPSRRSCLLAHVGTPRPTSSTSFDLSVRLSRAFYRHLVSPVGISRPFPIVPPLPCRVLPSQAPGMALSVHPPGSVSRALARRARACGAPRLRADVAIVRVRLGYRDDPDGGALALCPAGLVLGGGGLCPAGRVSEEERWRLAKRFAVDLRGGNAETDASKEPSDAVSAKNGGSNGTPRLPSPSNVVLPLSVEAFWDSSSQNLPRPPLRVPASLGASAAPPLVLQSGLDAAQALRRPPETWPWRVGLDDVTAHVEAVEVARDDDRGEAGSEGRGGANAAEGAGNGWPVERSGDGAGPCPPLPFQGTPRWCDAAACPAVTAPTALCPPGTPPQPRRQRRSRQIRASPRLRAFLDRLRREEEEEEERLSAERAEAAAKAALGAPAGASGMASLARKPPRSLGGTPPAKPPAKAARAPRAAPGAAAPRKRARAAASAKPHSDGEACHGASASRETTACLLDAVPDADAAPRPAPGPARAPRAAPPPVNLGLARARAAALADGGGRLEGLTGAELKAILKAAGLATSGKKAVLEQRALEARAWEMEAGRGVAKEEGKGEVGRGGEGKGNVGRAEMGKGEVAREEKVQGEAAAAPEE